MGRALSSRSNSAEYGLNHSGHDELLLRPLWKDDANLVELFHFNLRNTTLISMTVTIGDCNKIILSECHQ